MKPILTLTGRMIASFAMLLMIQLGASFVFSADLQLYIPSLAITTWVMLILFNHDQIDLGIQQNDLVRKQTQGFLFGILLISLVFSLIWLFQAVNIHHASFTATTLSSFISTTFLFFIVAFQEELFFRGYLFSLTENLFNQKVAIIFTSIIFALMHALNPNAFSNPLPLINILLAGLLLALMRVYSKGIWLPIGFHWSWNLFQGTIFGFHVSGISIDSVIQLSPIGHPILSGGDFGAEGSIMTSMILLGSIVGIYWYHTRKQKTEKLAEKNTG